MLSHSTEQGNEGEFPGNPGDPRASGATLAPRPPLGSRLSDKCRALTQPPSGPWGWSAYPVPASPVPVDSAIFPFFCLGLCLMVGQKISKDNFQYGFATCKLFL